MASTKIKTPADWASAQLGSLGVQNSKQDVTDLVSWWQHEGGAGPQFGVPNNDDNYNPINATQPEPGSVSTNASGVQSYTSWKEGLNAVTTTLEAGDYGYPAVYNDLVTNAPYSKFASDVTASKWGTDLSGTTADPNATPSMNSYDSGVQATINAGSAANQPSTTNNAGPMTGIGGILQTLDSLYNPAQKGINWDPLSILTAIPSDVESLTIQIFTRTVSSVIAVGLIFMGIRTFLSGEGASGGGSSNVLEFVNNAKISNTRAQQSERRLRVQEQESARKSAKPKVKVQLVERGKYLS